jgi:hypothetical protein
MKARSSFQVKALQQVLGLMSAASVPAPNVQWVDGSRESYEKVKWEFSPTSRIEAYLYNDAAGFMRNGAEWTSFEAADYRSPEELLEAFVVELRKVIEASRSPSS